MGMVVPLEVNLRVIENIYTKSLQTASANIGNEFLFEKRFFIVKA